MNPNNPNHMATPQPTVSIILADLGAAATTGIVLLGPALGLGGMGVNGTAVPGMGAVWGAILGAV